MIAYAIGECLSIKEMQNVAVDRSCKAFVIDLEIVEESVGKILHVYICFPSFSVGIFEYWDSFTECFTSSFAFLKW